MVATVWEAGRGTHWPAKSQAKRSVKSGKIRGIKIAPTATYVRGNCTGCYSCCFEIILIHYLVCKIESPLISASRKWVIVPFEFLPVHLLLQVWHRSEKNTWKDGSGINMECLLLQKKDRETGSAPVRTINKNAFSYSSPEPTSPRSATTGKSKDVYLSMKNKLIIVHFLKLQSKQKTGGL